MIVLSSFEIKRIKLKGTWCTEDIANLAFTVKRFSITKYQVLNSERSLITPLLFAYLLTYLLTDLLTYLLTYLLTSFLTYLL